MDTITRARTHRLWLSRLSRIATLAIFIYFGILLVFLALETELVYHSSPASAFWREPASPAVREVELTSPPGARLHGW
jgi:hypothetical protein